MPLVVPEVNPEALEGSPRIIAVPNCTTIVAMMALAPLHRAAGLRSLVLSSYQAVSGAGRDGTRELAEQIEKLHDQVEELGHPDLDALPTGDVFGKTMAFNVLPKIDAFANDGSTGEEVKTVQESRKILGIADLDVAATCVRVPVPVGHSVSLFARFSRPITPDEARGLLMEAPGVEVRDDPANGVYPVAAGGSGQRRGPGRTDPSGAGPRRLPSPLRVRRQPPKGRGVERHPDRGTPLLAGAQNGQSQGVRPHLGHPSAYRATAFSRSTPTRLARDASQASTSPNSWLRSARSPFLRARASSPTSSVSHRKVALVLLAASRSPYTECISPCSACNSMPEV